MNTKQSTLACNVHFNDVTALVKDEEDNLICFLGKVSTPEMKFPRRVSLAPFSPILFCAETREFLFGAKRSCSFCSGFSIGEGGSAWKLGGK